MKSNKFYKRSIPDKINDNIFRLKRYLHKESLCASRTQGGLNTDEYITSDKGSYRIGLLALMLLLFAFSTLIIKANAQHKQSLQLQIADEIIRFHVIANSDSVGDQALKLTVKDTLVKNLAPYLNEASSLNAAREILIEKMSYIKELAQNTINQQGYSYPVKVSLEECYFPLKVYGEYAFPPGNYEALRVQIGAAEGKNWWCVMFPPLCFVDETYSIIDESSGKKLKYLLTEEEYESLKTKKAPVKIKFKLLEIIKNLFK
jgi:stage II sporulation protein R